MRRKFEIRAETHHVTFGLMGLPRGQGHLVHAFDKVIATVMSATNIGSKKIPMGIKMQTADYMSTYKETRPRQSLSQFEKGVGGFTLIELMVTVAIVGILAAIALPSYQSHLRKGNRAQAQAYMLDLAQRQAQYLTDARSYAPDVATLGAPTPSALSNLYTFQITTNATPPTFIVTATAVGSQVADGNLSIDNTGTKTPADKW